MNALAITTTHNICSRCGEVAKDGIGANGRHLCGKCCDDRPVLNAFMADVSKAVRNAAGLLMHCDLGGERR